MPRSFGGFVDSDPFVESLKQLSNFAACHMSPRAPKLQLVGPVEFGRFVHGHARSQRRSLRENSSCHPHCLQTEILFPFSFFVCLLISEGPPTITVNFRSEIIMSILSYVHTFNGRMPWQKKHVKLTL